MIALLAHPHTQLVLVDGLFAALALGLRRARAGAREVSPWIANQAGGGQRVDGGRQRKAPEMCASGWLSGRASSSSAKAGDSPGQTWHTGQEAEREERSRGVSSWRARERRTGRQRSRHCWRAAALPAAAAYLPPPALSALPAAGPCCPVPLGPLLLLTSNRLGVLPSAILLPAASKTRTKDDLNGQSD